MLKEVMMDILWRGQKGYERLLGVTGGWAEGGGFVLVETERRHEPEWANWVLPIWFLRWGEMRVCSVAPDKRGVVERLWPLVAGEEGLLGAGLLAAARAEVGLAAEGWHGREILAYLGGEVWLDDDWGAVAWLTGDSADGYRFLNYFDGGVGVLRSEAGEVMSYVGVKDKGVIQEIAVGTEAKYRGLGCGTAVVRAAVAKILAAGKVPVFVPDRVDNVASYGLGRKVGFEKVGEMFFWEYAMGDWAGFEGGGGLGR